MARATIYQYAAAPIPVQDDGQELAEILQRDIPWEVGGLLAYNDSCA